MTKNKEIQVIQNRIYEIRGCKVMIDFDLAEMYQVETRILNQAIKRNIERFPEDFMFQLTNQEFTILKSQIVISSWGGTRKPPYVFTEHGVAMLSGILRSSLAIQVNINIIRAFIAMRKLILSTPASEVKELQSEVKELKEYIEEVFTDYNDINEETRIQLELINETLAELQARDKKLNLPKRPIGYI